MPYFLGAQELAKPLTPKVLVNGVNVGELSNGLAHRIVDTLDNGDPRRLVNCPDNKLR
jgi:hypothetical protein